MATILGKIGPKIKKLALFHKEIKSNSTMCKILGRIRDHNDRLYVFSILVIIYSI